MSEIYEIHATFDGANRTRTEAVWQWDYGQVLVFDDLDLPTAYEVHFSNSKTLGTSITQIGDETGVTIPNSLFESGLNIYAWVFLHVEETDGTTVYFVTIPVRHRAVPDDDTPTPEEESAIAQAIVALNNAVSETAEAVAVVENLADLTQGYAEDAEYASQQAQEAVAKFETTNFYINEVGHLIVEQSEK